MSRSPSRRDVLRLSVGAAAATFAIPSFGRLLADETAPTTAPSLAGAGRAKRLILLYMNGGASQFETFDPKPGTTTGGPTRTVATTLPGVEFADSLPLLARRTGEMALVRSLTSKEGNHDRARYLAHTGFVPNPTVVHPSIGAILSHEKGKEDAEIPEYVSIGGPGLSSGYLGVDHAPFVVQDPRKPIQNLELPAGLSERRLDARLELLGEVNARFARDHGTRVTEGQEAMFRKARRLMESERVRAFDLSKVPARTSEAFGDSAFGVGCLVARRLVDEGVTSIEVMHGNYDTHDDNFSRTKALNADLDRGASALLDSLKADGLLETTLVVWIGDFGRTPDVTATEGRGHYPRAWSAWLAGGGVRGGRVIGRTDALGREVVDRPVTIPDLFASMAHALGIEGGKTFHTNGRPITLVDKAGVPVPELF